MAWIESHTILLRHRKLIGLADDLGLPPVYVVGHLHALWYAALEQADSGDLSNWPDEFIAAAATYTGDAKQFVRLLQKHGWLDGAEIGRKILHDWLDYVGKYLREYKYRRAAEKYDNIVELHKWLKSLSMTENTSVIDTVPNLTGPNQKLKAERNSAPPDKNNANPLKSLSMTPRTNSHRQQSQGVSKKNQHTSQVQKFVADFSEAYKSMAHLEYKTTAKDFVLIAKLLRQYDLATLTGKMLILRTACERGQVWFARNGPGDFTISNLAARWNDVVSDINLTEQERKDKDFLRRQRELEAQ